MQQEPHHVVVRKEVQEEPQEQVDGPPPCVTLPTLVLRRAERSGGVQWVLPPTVYSSLLPSLPSTRPSGTGDPTPGDDRVVSTPQSVCEGQSLMSSGTTWVAEGRLDLSPGPDIVGLRFFVWCTEVRG